MEGRNSSLLIVRLQSGVGRALTLNYFCNFLGSSQLQKQVMTQKHISVSLWPLPVLKLSKF